MKSEHQTKIPSRLARDITAPEIEKADVNIQIALGISSEEYYRTVSYDPTPRYLYLGELSLFPSQRHHPLIRASSSDRH